MIEIEEEYGQAEKILLVARNTDRTVPDETVIREISSLADTAGFTIAGAVVLTRNEPAARYAMGSGKAKEIAGYAAELDASYIIFDFEITPTQQRNWEALSSCICMDRQELVIRIFAERAMTREAVLQIELARLTYALPRLAHTYSALSRQRGGRYGTKGAGETQLELDRRSIISRMAQIRRELKTVRSDRAVRRKRRERSDVPSCAIVGYTNAGKSSLLNAVTGASVAAENKLFATLDPTTRRFTSVTGRSILLTDTVGFIRNLPHTLIDAFRSTLEEAVFADGIIILLDASDEDIKLHLETTYEVLKEIGAENQYMLQVLNKIDCVDEFTRERLHAEYPRAVQISTRTGEGMQELLSRLDLLFSGEEHLYKLPAARSDLVSYAHREGTVTGVVYEADYILLKAHTDGRLAAVLKEFEYAEKK
ncbi:GTPase HflX [Brucepastera parasyntrophica]|uniref:GTPase HflX n=1 Tax=Brucepastera parasyntrophica TaxID=2880008 RepID=UPI00210D3E77|nr:GTPase HflX [Brucepastera parasyntrophica]ULQ58718.1 GTPase HflX [Brucepastera parasyntrophica]